MKDKIITLASLFLILICNVLSLCFGKNLVLAQVIICYTCVISAAIAIIFWISDILRHLKLRDAINYDLQIIEKAKENHFLTAEEERELLHYRRDFDMSIKSSSEVSDLERFRDLIKTRFNRFLVSETQ